MKKNKKLGELPRRFNMNVFMLSRQNPYLEIKKKYI